MPPIRDVAVGRDLRRLHLAEQEAGEGVAAGAGGVEVAVGEEAGGGAAIEVVGAGGGVPAVAVVAILLEGEAGLHGVPRLHPGQVVRDVPQIVARPAPFRPSPVEIVVGEVEQREQLVGPGHVLQPDARAPALIAVVGGAQLIPVVVPERDAVHQRRRDDAIPVGAIDVGVRVLVAEVVERHRQAAARTVARRHHQHFAPVQQEAEAVLGRQVVIELDAELVPRVGVDLVARRVGEVVADAAAGRGASSPAGSPRG